MWRRDRYRTGQHSTNDVHTSLEKKNNCDLVNHQHFRLVSSTKVKIDLVIVFIFKDPLSSRLSLVLVTGKRSLTNIFRHSFSQQNEHSHTHTHTHTPHTHAYTHTHTHTHTHTLTHTYRIIH